MFAKDLTARIGLALAGACLTGCFLHLGSQYSHGGYSYTMSSAQIDYLKKATAEIDAKVKQLMATNDDEGAALEARCNAYDPYIEAAPNEWARNFTSAKKLLERDKQDACRQFTRYENAEKQRAIAESRANEAKARQEEYEHRAAARRAQEQLAQERETERKAKLQSTVHTVGGVRCQAIDFRRIGEEIGSDLSSSSASGLYVGVLVKCENTGRSSLRMSSSDFALKDGAGRTFAVDLDGSIEALIWQEDDQIKNPELLQLHPGVPTYVGLIFDVPDEVIVDPDLQVAIGQALFPLNFEGFDVPES